jgi:ribosomal protein S18 acetylase RimI-like enzyme
MSPYTIAQTDPSDLPVVFELFEAAIAYQKRHHYPAWKDFYQEIVDADMAARRQYKIILDGQIACIFTPMLSDQEIWRHHDDGNAVYLHRIITNPGFKGRRLFEQVLNWAAGFARQHGRTYIRMDTWARNPNLIAYYEGYGFRFFEHYTTPDSEEVPEQHRNINVVLLQLDVPERSFR